MADATAPPRGEETAKLLKRASKGDKTCLPELRALLADPERGGRILEIYGSPDKWLVADLLGQVAGDDLAVSEATARKLAEVRDELAGPNPMPIERLLAERAAVCWFLVNRYESNFSNAKDLTIRQAAFHQEKIDRAHKRYLSALKTLATVRKLALPAIQVNIAKEQVNVAGGG
jgi:hypothetical protein